MLWLLPGEETIFELRVVNHGDPSNISVDASPPLIKAMRLKRSNHYVKLEEVIPVLARMPDNVERVDGELLVTSESGTSRVPISLLSEADGTSEEVTEKEDEPESIEIEDDGGVYEDDKEDGLEEEELQDQNASCVDSSGDEDYQNYATSRRRRCGASGRVDSERRKPQNYQDTSNEEDRSSSNPDNRSRQNYNQAYDVESKSPYYSDENSDPSAQEPSYQSSSDAEDEETRSGLFGLDIVAEQIVPIIMLVLIIVVLALTFYTSTIPEFPGALASSILIVTLIIYGAATLLKA